MVKLKKNHRPLDVVLDCSCKNGSRQECLIHGHKPDLHPYQGLIGDGKSDFKIDLGCGPNKKAGFLGFDSIKFPGVDFVVDLLKEWPISNNCVAEAHSSHCIEHFDAMERVHFLNELYRVLKPGAKCTLIAPHWSSCRAYGDPTHKWPPVSEFGFFYWKKDWRMANAPHSDASNLKGGFNCNFEVTWGYSLNPEVAQRNQDYQQYAMTFLKEAVMDVIATLTAVK